MDGISQDWDMPVEKGKMLGVKGKTMRKKSNCHVVMTGQLSNITMH